MTDNSNQVNKLLEKLEVLLKRQEDFSNEIENLRSQILELKPIESKEDIRPISKEENKEVVEIEAEIQKETISRGNESPAQKNIPIPPKNTKVPKAKIDLEKLIGENLINKIGIVITIIGVGIGAKYSIEHELISPLTRIILAYLIGLGLLGFGIKLKQKYESFSSVLVSGAMAIMYFVTFGAYGMYGLIPQLPAFLLMVLFTVFTVYAATAYNKQVIALIGLVGAYAVPFLLSDGSGKIAVFFTYIAIINTGILMLSIKKYWKPLYYSSFGLTWLIYLTWYVMQYTSNSQFTIAFTFLALFFTLFYLTFLAYKLVREEIFNSSDIVLLLANSFIFYGLGYSLLSSIDGGDDYLGLFTICNAGIHFIASALIHRQKLADKNLQHLIIGLVLVFITISVPVQLDGNWVTLLWTGEAALLFWIGRTKSVAIYEQLSFPMMLLAFLSITHDWTMFYEVFYFIGEQEQIPPVLNVNFLSSSLFVVAFGFITFLNSNKKYQSSATIKKSISSIMSYVIPAIFILGLYVTFRNEIANYWNQLFIASKMEVSVKGQENHFWNYDLMKFKIIWILMYTLLFVSALSFVNHRKIKNQQLGYISMGLIILVLWVFLTQGLYQLSELRESYLTQIHSDHYSIGYFNIAIRYLVFGCVFLAIYSGYQFIRQEFVQKNFKIAYDMVIHLTIIIIASFELINWMDIAGATNSFKLGLSILWGIYSLLLISLGIWKNKKHLRIGAIVLFSMTLVKLFFYDISHLNTISKTIVFVSLGILLLIISFLYNKYKHLITNEVE